MAMATYDTWWLKWDFRDTFKLNKFFRYWSLALSAIPDPENLKNVQSE